MSFLDKAKDLLNPHDDEDTGHTPEQQSAGNGDATATTGPGVADGAPAEEQQLE